MLTAAARLPDFGPLAAAAAEEAGRSGGGGVARPGAALELPLSCCSAPGPLRRAAAAGDARHLLAVLMACVLLAAKNNERVPYRRLLPTLLQALAARELPPASSAALELDVLVALEWRLGPFYSAEERAEAAEAAGGVEGAGEAAAVAAAPPPPPPPSVVVVAAAAIPQSDLDNSRNNAVAAAAGKFCWLSGDASRASSLGASSSTCCA